MRTECGALVSEVKKAKSKGICRRVDGYQSQDSSRPSTATDGTAGAAGCPEHNAPEHGGRGDASGGFSDRPDRSCINGLFRDGNCQESARELTRCEQPPFAVAGADNAIVRTAKMAPVESRAGRFWVSNFLSIKTICTVT
jgi:hypothetical protein